MGDARLQTGRVLRALLALLLALLLVPVVMPGAAQADEEAGESATDRIVAQLSAGEYIEGEALVVYQSDATQARAFSLESTNSLAAAGFSVEDSWDFSGVDAVTEDFASAGEQAVSTLALDEGSTEENCELDATAARVTKPGADTAQLLEELSHVGGVVAVAPNYVHKLESNTAEDIPEATPVRPAEVANKTTSFSNSEAAVSSDAALAQATIGETDILPVDSTSTISNDPLSILQWSLDNDITANGFVADSDVNLTNIYSDAKSGKENIIAVLDEGVDYTHADLKNVMWNNPGNIPGVPGEAGTCGYDFVSGDDDPAPVANDSHGTHCAGIVAATSDNDTGISGVSPNSKIMALRIGGSDNGGKISDGATLAAYEYVIRAKLGGENVVATNNSWSGYVSPVTEYAINQAGRAGILSVFCAGNNNMDNNSISNNQIIYSLSESPYIISAAATSPQGTYAAYTNHNDTAVDIATPGSIILSTVSSDTYQPAVAKATDVNNDTPGEHSLYYNNMTGLNNENATITLYNVKRDPLPQENLTTSIGIGMDGREALKVNEKDAKAKPLNGEAMVDIHWSIKNPFKGMTWEKAREAYLSVLPSVSTETGEDAQANAASFVYAWPYLKNEAGAYLTAETPCGAYTDQMFCDPACLETEEQFNTIKDADTIVVGMYVVTWMNWDNADATTASFTLTDFGIGFSEGLAYDYYSGTSMACPLAAGGIGVLASLHPEDSALELRGRLVGGTKQVHDTSAEGYSQFVGNTDEKGISKQTASNGMLDLAVAAGSSTHPNTWGASATEDGSAIVLEGYNLNCVKTLSVDGTEIDTTLWKPNADGSQLTVQLPDKLNGGRHTVNVSDGASTHKGAYTFPQAEQKPAFEKVGNLPDDADISSGILLAAADRIFCLDTKGRYLYSYNPQEPYEWTACQSPVDAGFTVSNFRCDTAATYADGKLYATVYYEKTDDDTGNMTLFLAGVAYDIATNAWDTNGVELTYGHVAESGSFVPSVALTSCLGDIYLNTSGRINRTVAVLDPDTGDVSEVVVDDASDPTKSFRLLKSVNTPPLLTVGSKVYFLGYVADGTNEATGQARYALTLGSYDGQTFDVLDTTESTPRFDENEFDKYTALIGQAIAATGDSIVFTGASLEGLGETYQVNCETGEWTSLGVRSPGNSPSEVTKACLYRGTYYTLAADANVENNPSTALYRMSSTINLVANDHTASAQASEGGAAYVTYGTNEAQAPSEVEATDEAGATGSSLINHVALGDTVTWTAVPSVGYTFAGWYDTNGTLVDTAQSYSQPIASDVSLNAKFAPETKPQPTPVPDPDPQPTPTPDSESQPATDTSAKATPSTGDNVGALAGGTAAFLALVSLYLLVRAARRVF